MIKPSQIKTIVLIENDILSRSQVILENEKKSNSKVSLIIFHH